MSLRLEREERLNVVVFVGPCAETFNTVGNAHGSAIFLLVEKIKIVSLSWNLVHNLIRISRIQWWCSLFMFWANLVKKKQNCEFKLKFGAKTNSNLQNSIAVFNFSVLDFEYPFGGTLFQKIKIIILSWKFVPRLIRIYRIQWWCSLFQF